MTRTVALIVAAGKGERLGASLPKQYLSLQGKTLLRHAIDRFLQHPSIDMVYVVIDPAQRALYEEAVAGLNLPSPIAGGVTRQESVRHGLERLAQEDPVPARVLIHDAARPFVSAGLVDRVLRALETAPGAIPALPVADTIKQGSGGLISTTIDRSALWRAQTPQGFIFQEIWAAHRRAAGKNLTDDAAVAEDAGLAVSLVAGEEENFKVTIEADLRRAQQQNAVFPEYRTGNGFDVHKFKAGDGVTICGIHVPHDQSLEGHSDADVGLHALTDALLGALGEGDIGQHFPPSDPQWRGADSGQFLNHAASLAARKGAAITHVDVTVICERPKIGPHRAAMTAKIAELIGITPDRVSVKATTTEGLGFTGRREGIAAQATATIMLYPKP